MGLYGHFNKIKDKYTALSFIAVCCLLLSSCNSIQETTPITTSHIITIIPQDGDTPESLAEEYSGEVISFEEGEIAIVEVKITESNKNTISQLSNGSVEVNSNAFSMDSNTGISSSSSKVWAGGKSSLWAGGKSSLWAGGKSSLWAGGKSSLWAGGTFDWMPENTAVWKQIKLDAGHNKSKDFGLATIVAVIDTGVDYTHPALSQAIKQGKDFYDNDNDPFDEGRLFKDKGTGHGTHIAGIIRQIAPRATILPIRVLGPDGRGNVADLAAAILWAEKQGADIINLSLGSNNYSYAVDQALAIVEKRGVIVVASVGNQGVKGVNFPARKLDAENSQISVSSVNRWDNKSSFSNFTHSIEIAAPGEQIYGPAPGGMKVAWSGTSMAAPMVAGALALGVGEKSKKVKNSALTIQLKQSGNNIYSNGKNSRYIDQYGKQIGQGRLDIGKFFDNIH